MRRLDVRLRLLVNGFRAELAERARDPLLGLSISDADVDGLLTDAPWEGRTDGWYLRGAALASTRLQRLAELCGLDSFEQEALLVCLAPDVELRYERLYGYLQDDVTRRRPSVDLVLRLLAPPPEAKAAARAALGQGGRLMRSRLLFSDEPPTQASSLSRPLRVDERVVLYLLGSDAPDPRLGAYARLSEPTAEPLPGVFTEDMSPGLSTLLAGAGLHVVYLYGPDGVARQAAARCAGLAIDRRLLSVDVPDLLAEAGERAVDMLGLAAREALLQEAVLVLDRFDRLFAEAHAPASLAVAVRRVIREHTGPVLLLGVTRWEPSVWIGGPALAVELPVVDMAARALLWASHLGARLPVNELAALADRYRLVDDADLRAVATEADCRAILRGAGHVTLADVQAAARAVAAPPLEGVAHRVESRYSWQDIVLAPDALGQLRELCGRITHSATVLETWGYGRKHVRRKGATALFVGPPGTGKTMAAEILAGELGLDLYRIDLASVVSKYIGETEKNLEVLFRAADHGDAVLLFDEADALFGKRTEVRDAHDRYANVEVAYLLQRLETYQGLAILTTNLRGNIDEGFLRRLDCVLEFPIPEPAERLRIWQNALAPEAPRRDDLDFEFLAAHFALAGGHIRNVAVCAAFLAAGNGTSIGMQDLVRAIRREYQKLGKLVGEADFQRFYPLLFE